MTDLKTTLPAAYLMINCLGYGERIFDISDDLECKCGSKPMTICFRSKTITPSDRDVEEYSTFGLELNTCCLVVYKKIVEGYADTPLPIILSIKKRCIDEFNKNENPKIREMWDYIVGRDYLALVSDTKGKPKQFKFKYYYDIHQSDDTIAREIEAAENTTKV